jgi:hypothetical protein
MNSTSCAWQPSTRRGRASRSICQPIDDIPEGSESCYAFVYGDFRRLHRMGLIACQYRAAEWRHKEVELAAHDLLQYFDKRSG